MFRSKTVFILGAGSSHEVGLPLGSSLKMAIAEKINIQYDFDRRISGDADIAQALVEHTRNSDNCPDPTPYILQAQQLSKALWWSYPFYKRTLLAPKNKVGVVRSVRWKSYS